MLKRVITAWHVVASNSAADKRSRQARCVLLKRDAREMCARCARDVLEVPARLLEIRMIIDGCRTALGPQSSIVLHVILKHVGDPNNCFGVQESACEASCNGADFSVSLNADAETPLHAGVICDADADADADTDPYADDEADADAIAGAGAIANLDALATANARADAPRCCT
eukprot:6174425-Pleurochrysis_carterae.AAC.1